MSGREESEAAGGEDCADEDHLSAEERQSLFHLLVQVGSAAGADAYLHEVNLVTGKQPVGQPQRERDAVEFAGGNVIRARRSRGEAHGADDLRRHSSFAARAF